MVLISRFRSWWQRASKPLAVAIIIVLVLAGLIVLIYVGYGFTWPETGFGSEISEPKQHAKTLWDWMQLLFVPAILTLGGLWFSTRQNHDLQIAADNQSEAAL